MGFPHVALKTVLSPYHHHTDYWDRVRRAFYDPYLPGGAVHSSGYYYSKEGDEDKKKPPSPPLVVVVQRFVWDVPHFRNMLRALIESQV